MRCLFASLESNQKRIYLFFIGIYSFLAISSVFSGITSWDEETDYLGIRSQIAHGIQLLRGQGPDYREIHSNLEYYGSVGLLPAWLLWFVQQSLIVGRLSLQKALYDPAAEHQLTGFYSTSHLILGLEFLLLSYVVVKIANCIDLKLPWIAGTFVFLNPSLVGHSFVNPKDIPFALFYTLYTYTVISRGKRSERYLWYISLFIASLLVNQKFVAIVPVILTETLYFLLYKRSYLGFIQYLCFPITTLIVALALQPASWGLNPLHYLVEAFDTFANHEWGGCMYWSSTCIGVNHPEWSTLRYMFNWLTIKLPLFWVFLVSVQLFCFAKNTKRICQTFHSPWVFVVAQCLLIPILAALRQSNLYDADRHLLFIYPSLAIIATTGLEKLLYLDKSILKTMSIILALFLAFVLAIDTLSLNPYQTSYLNEFARFSHNHKSTSLDYWGVSSKELIRNSQLYGSLSSPPVLKQGIWISPFWISFRQLGGISTTEDNSYSPLFQLRNPTSFDSHKDRSCKYDTSVERNLLFSNKLVLSKLYLCKD